MPSAKFYFDLVTAVFAVSFSGLFQSFQFASCRVSLKAVSLLLANRDNIIAKTLVVFRFISLHRAKFSVRLLLLNSRMIWRTWCLLFLLKLMLNENFN